MLWVRSRSRGAGKNHGEVVVVTPEQCRAVNDALRGYLANYEAVWRADQIEGGRHWALPTMSQYRSRFRVP